MRKHQVVATQTYLVSFWEKNQLIGICTTLRIISNLNCSTNACFLSFQYHPIHLGVEKVLAPYFQLVILFCFATYKVRPTDRNHSCQKKQGHPRPHQAHYILQLNFQNFKWRHYTWLALKISRKALDWHFRNKLFTFCLPSNCPIHLR